MRCVAPLTAFRRVGVLGVRFKPQTGDTAFLLPCGSCVACLLNRSRQHAIRCVHESEMHERSCFVTLTYDEEHLPYAGSLVKEHMSRFMRDLREKFEEPIRFFGCGEYGSRWGRPHYHLIVYGVDFVQDRYVAGRRSGEDVYRSPCLESVWKMGRSEIGSATFESAAYVARYVATKCSDSGLAGREPEFLLSSLKPGIGVPWIEENWRHVYARDSVVVRGCEAKPPRMYDKWLGANHPDVFRRVARARKAEWLEPGTDPDERTTRWVVMEEVLKAKLNFFAREVEV